MRWTRWTRTACWPQPGCASGRPLRPAEDAWFALLERDGARAGEVARFYDRLEALPDAALAQGGLPRAELAEGRASLAR